MSAYDNPGPPMISITTATAPVAWSAQSYYVDLSNPLYGGASPLSNTAFTCVPFVAQLSEADKEALRTMIREEIRTSIKDIAVEVVREINRQLRMQGGQCRSS